MTRKTAEQFKTKGFLRNFEAYHYWLTGDGSPRSIPIQELNVENVKLEDSEELRKAMEQTKGRDASVSIVSKIPMPSTGDVLGQYTLGTKGILHSKRDGTQIYEGYIGGYDDLYDFNSDPTRGDAAEMATKIGAFGGKIYGRHADFPIQIEGRIPIRRILK